MYLDIARASGYIECNSIAEKDGNNYLVSDDIDENKGFKNMKKFGRVLKKIETINGGEKIEYGKDFKKLHLILMMAYH